MHAIRKSFTVKVVSKENAVQAAFGDCLVSLVSGKNTEENDPRGLSVNLLFDPMKSEFTLSKEEEKTLVPYTSLKFKHARECPAMRLTAERKCDLLDSSKAKGIRVGVAVLLTTVDQQVLLTQRGWHMRLFPGVWVPPGGHIEDGETLEEAGLRELHEETGLDLASIDKECCVTPLCLWESLFPPSLDYGLPTYQHLVVYLLAYSSLTSDTIIEKLKLDPNEVDSALLLPSNYVEALTLGRKEGLSDTLPVIRVSPSGEHTRSEIPSSVILAKAPEEGVSEIAMERLSWGTRYALKEWLDRTKLVKSLL